jgi:diguanylate cyclase (GGDEF)-like protein
MEELESNIFDEFAATFENVTCGEYESVNFEKFMRVGNPSPIRRLATIIENVCRQFKSREHHLKIAVDELQTARAELEQFNALLDSRVKERTRALEEANSLLESISTTDSLTGISNRRNFDEKLSYEFSRALRYNIPLSCIMFDIDFFKKVNDSYGHLYGDEVLRMIGKTLKEELRSHDIFARYGGEEFVILLPETRVQSAEKVSEKLRVFTSKKVVCKDNIQSKVTISLGVAQLDPEKMSSGSDLVEAADKAMYQAKRTGRNKTVVFNSGEDK